MPTINDYIQNLKGDKSNLVANLNAKDISASNSETFTELVPKVLMIGGAEEKDVNFYDYDGTRLYSYTAEEIQTLTSLPANPTHTGLTSQGWNWTLAGIKNYVTKYGKCDIGQSYVTDDNSTRIYITLSQYWQSLYVGIQINGSGTIDWGDGSTPDTISGTNTYVTKQHTYEDYGDYVIKIIPDDATTKFVISSTNAYGFRLISENVSGGDDYGFYKSGVKKIELGDNVTISNYAFQYCAMEFITIPSGTITNLGQYAFNRCPNLKNVILPISQRYLSNTSAFAYCTNLKRAILPELLSGSFGTIEFIQSGIVSLVIPDGVTNLNNQCAQECASLETVVIPETTNLGSTCFGECKQLKNVITKNGVKGGNYEVFYWCSGIKSIDWANNGFGTRVFYSCSRLVNINVLTPITYFYSEALNNCRSLHTLDLTSCTTIPTLDINVFSGTPSALKILVPDSLYEDWVLATNWSSTTDNIVNKITPVDTNGNILTKATVSLAVSSALTDTTIDVSTSVRSVVGHTYTLPSYSDLTTTAQEENLVWSDGENIYNLGDSITLSGDISLTLIDTSI